MTDEPTGKILEECKSIWMQYKDQLRPNRKSGEELLRYLLQKYVLTEIQNVNALDTVIYNVKMNAPYAEKLTPGAAPIPRAFFLENAGNGVVFYKRENKDPIDTWGGDISRIFVGIDLATGYFTVEGSTMLWDELYAFRGLDEKDLQNYVCVGQYISCLKRFALLQDALFE